MKKRNVKIGCLTFDEAPGHRNLSRLLFCLGFFLANIVYNAGLYPSFIGRWIDMKTTGPFKLTAVVLAARPLCEMKNRILWHPPGTHCAAVTPQQMARETFAFGKSICTTAEEREPAWWSEVDDVDYFTSQGICSGLILEPGSFQAKRYNTTQPIAVLLRRKRRSKNKELRCDKNRKFLLAWEQPEPKN